MSTTKPIVDEKLRAIHQANLERLREGRVRKPVLHRKGLPSHQAIQTPLMRFQRMKAQQPTVLTPTTELVQARSPYSGILYSCKYGFDQKSPIIQKGPRKGLYHCRPGVGLSYKSPQRKKSVVRRKKKSKKVKKTGYFAKKCNSSQVRRKRDGRCLKRSSPAGKRVLRARKAARARSQNRKRSR